MFALDMQILTAWWKPHTRKIVLHSFIIAAPMLISSFALVAIVYNNLIPFNCPAGASELCHSLVLDPSGPAFINSSSGIANANYFVDYPAARLAFISSWSSTISFAMLSFLMAFAAYVNASSLLTASDRKDEEMLPSPHQMSVLLRVLNAEMLVLWEMGVDWLRRVFWKKEQEKEMRSGTGDPDSTQQTATILRVSIIVLLGGILASLLVQTADVYFHLAAQAIELVQIQALASASNEYSRGLAPWCLDRPETGPLGPKSFFGCAITAQAASYNNATSLAPTNATIIQDLKNSVSDQHRVFNYTDADNVQHAVIVPANADQFHDWKATSFAVSTTCNAIRENACVVSQPITNAKDGAGSPIMLVPFNCSQNSAGINIRGNLTSHNTKTHMLNFHKYANESAPFQTNFMNTPTGLSPAALLELVENGDPNDVFKNPWQALVMRKIPFALQADFDTLPPLFRADDRIWKHPLLGAFSLMLCNITVWDITYTASGSNIVSLTTKSPSNGTTAGIASMPGTRFLGTLANVFQDESTGPESRSSPTAFIRSFELGMSKAYSYPLASQLSNRPSLLSQVRTSKLVTRLPVAALWFLVLTNWAYATLGIGLAAWALGKTSPTVHQVQMRLGILGLAAALFDREAFERRAGADEKLFEEKGVGGGGAATKKVGVERTETGGSAFVVVPVRSRREVDKDLRARYLASSWLVERSDVKV